MFSQNMETRRFMFDTSNVLFLDLMSLFLLGLTYQFTKALDRDGCNAVHQLLVSLICTSNNISK